jgi:hypothetical protein
MGSSPEMSLNTVARRTAAARDPRLRIMTNPDGIEDGSRRRSPGTVRPAGTTAVLERPTLMFADALTTTSLTPAPSNVTLKIPSCLFRMRDSLRSQIEPAAGVELAIAEQLRLPAVLAVTPKLARDRPAVLAQRPQGLAGLGHARRRLALRRIDGSSAIPRIVAQGVTGPADLPAPPGDDISEGALYRRSVLSSGTAALLQWRVTDMTQILSGVTSRPPR